MSVDSPPISGLPEEESNHVVTYPALPLGVRQDLRSTASLGLLRLDDDPDRHRPGRRERLGEPDWARAWSSPT